MVFVSELILTAKVMTLTKKAHAARNHWNLHTDNEDSNDSSAPFIASNTIVDDGIKIKQTNKSASAILTTNAFPVKLFMKVIS